ncbi:hypothetical protein MN608_02390 [Microdochium nivale]|nr:hypothetical protein MN608_02390 [Microdochium nivale]
MGNTLSADALRKESRLRNRFSRTPAAAAASPSPPRRSSAAKDCPAEPAEYLDDSETLSDLRQHDESHPSPTATRGQSRPPSTAAAGCARRTYSLGARESTNRPKRTNSLTRTFSLSRARSLIHRPNSFMTNPRSAADHEPDLVADHPVQDNPYLRTPTSQCFEPWRPDIPKRPSSTGLPLLARPESAPDMALFNPTRRRSLQTPGVATRGPPSTNGRTSIPPSRRNSLARPQPLPILEVSAAAEDDDYDDYLTIPTRMPRASSPNELDFAQVGAYKFGTLRITNGSPTGTPGPGHAAEDETLDHNAAEYFSSSVASSWPEAPHVSTKTTGDVIEARVPVSVYWGERLDVRIDYNARSALSKPSKAPVGTLRRADSGIETSPVRERPEMRLSKADSGYSSKASIRSSYSENRAGKDAVMRHSFESPQGEVAMLSAYAIPASQPRFSPIQYAAEKAESAPGIHLGMLARHHNRPTQPHNNGLSAPRAAHKLFSSSRRQSKDEGRAEEVARLERRDDSSSGDQVRSHYHWKMPALPAGKGTLNSLFSLKRVDHAPLQATLFPPQKSRLSKENKKPYTMGGMSTNLAHVATALLPKKKAPTLHLKTELSTRLQHDDELDQDPRFSTPSSPYRRTSRFSGDEDLFYNRQVHLSGIKIMPDHTSTNVNCNPCSPTHPHAPHLARHNSHRRPESTRHASPPVSLNTRNKTSLTSTTNRRTRQSLPTYVGRGISLDGSGHASWQHAVSASQSTSPVFQTAVSWAIADNALGEADYPPLSPTSLQVVRRRSMVISSSQGQHRIPQWEVDADHHAARVAVDVSQIEQQEPTLPQLRRPNSAGSFMAPKIPERAQARQLPGRLSGHRPLSASPSFQDQDIPSTNNETLRDSSREPTAGVRAFALSLGKASSQDQGHSRNRSLGSFDRDGTPAQFRVLHSYHSPAYKNVPVWN